MGRAFGDEPTLFSSDGMPFLAEKPGRPPLGLEVPPPNVSALAVPPPLPHGGLKIRAAHGVGAFAGSIALHGVAAAAMALVVATTESPWILPQRHGKNAIALSASMAAPPPKSDEPLTLIPRETIPPAPKAPSPQPLDAQPVETVVKQANAATHRPSSAFAALRESRREPLAPISDTRAEIEAYEINQVVAAAHPRRKPRPAEDTPVPNSPAAPAPTETSSESTKSAAVASAASAAESGVVADQPPAIVHTVPPVYPPELKAARESGIVKLRVKVDVLGNVVEASIYRSSGFPRLDQAALDVIYANRFAPADTSAARRATEFVHPITFRLTTIPARR